MPNGDAPRISLGNWLSGGSILYMPPTPKKEQVKPKPPPKKVAAPKPKEAKKDDAPKAPSVVSEGTDSPDDVLKRANEFVAKAEALQKKAEEDAKKLEEAEAARKAAEEEAAKKKLEEEAAAKKKEEDEAEVKKKAQEKEAAMQKVLDDKIEELKKEKELYSLEEENEKLLQDLAKSIAKAELRAHANRSVSAARFCSICGRRSHDGECDDAPPEMVKSNSNNSFPVVNVNVYSGSDDAVKITGDKDAATATKNGDDGAKTDSKDKSDAKSDAKPIDNSKFTKEQDEKLLSLRSGNNTWTYIAKEMGISRNDCFKRHRELTGLGASTANSSKESSLPEGHIDMGEITVIGIDDAMKDDKSKDNNSEKNKMTGSIAGSKNSKNNGNYMKPTVEDASKKTDSFKENSNNNDSSSDSDSKNSGSSATTIKQCPPPEPRTYIPVSFSATIPLTGGTRNLVPDATWTIKDLECLAELECRYRGLKWQRLQAEFFNHTGRMIDARVIEAKIMEARLPEEEKAFKKKKEEEGRNQKEAKDAKEEKKEVNEVQFKLKLDKEKLKEGGIPEELQFKISAEELRKSLESGTGGKIDI